MGGERKRVSARLRFPSAENASYCRVPLNGGQATILRFFACRAETLKRVRLPARFSDVGPPSAAEPAPSGREFRLSIAFRSRDRTSITTELFPCPSTNTIALIAAKILKNG